MITIDVFQDTTCPWCRIGKAHLQQALAAWQGSPVEVRHRAFFLQPDLPPEGGDFRTVMESKGGGRIPLEGFFDAPRRMGAAAGMNFQFEKITLAPNTELSHRLIALAPAENRSALIDAVYAAYFEHGQDIGSLDVLLDLAAENGMDPAETRWMLEGDARRAEVLGDATWAHQVGITGVPFFIFNNRYALSGAQPSETFLQVLQAIEDGTIEQQFSG